MNWPAVTCLLAGALILAWPARKAGAVAGGPPRKAGGVVGDPPARRRLRRQRWCLPEGLFARPRRAILLSAGAIGGLGYVGGGPVAAVVAAVYSALAGRALFRRAARRRDGVSRAAALDDLSTLAADLRAGLPPATRLAVSPLSQDRIGRLTASVWRLAERTGAPAADLVERIEADARAADRATAKASAQAAGAQATALLLAALPIAGIALGLGIGADPIQVLLHTPIGAACGIGAVLLQCAGLLWAERLAK